MSVAERRSTVMADLLRVPEKPAHWLVVRASAPTIYGYTPRERDLESITAEAGVTATEVAHLADREGVWATLYRLD